MHKPDGGVSIRPPQNSPSRKELVYDRYLCAYKNMQEYQSELYRYCKTIINPGEIVKGKRIIYGAMFETPQLTVTPKKAKNERRKKNDIAECFTRKNNGEFTIVEEVII